MESLAKKYDERFKAAGEVNSRLLAEEAAFRDIQVCQLSQVRVVDSYFATTPLECMITSVDLTSADYEFPFGSTVYISL